MNALYKLIVVLLIILTSSSAYAELYTWVDDDGVTNYTSNINSVPKRFLNNENSTIGENKSYSLDLKLTNNNVFIISGLDSIDYIDDSYIHANVEYNREKPYENCFFKINGNTEKVIFSTSDANIATINEKGSITPKGKSGNITIYAKLNNETSSAALNITLLPLSKNMTKEQVISILGIPDEKNQSSVKWYESGSFDGHLYTGYSGNPIIFEHWRYKKYPYAILRFDSKNLFRLAGCITINEDRSFKEK